MRVIVLLLFEMTGVYLSFIACLISGKINCLISCDSGEIEYITGLRNGIACVCIIEAHGATRI